MGLTLVEKRSAGCALTMGSMSPIGIQARGTFNSPNDGIISGVPRQFAVMLKPLMDAKFPSGRAFIRAAERGRDEDSGAAYLSKVLAGTKPAPLERVEGWANALNLTGTERAHFLSLAELSHGPETVEAEYLRMHQELAELRSAVREARQRGIVPRQPGRQKPE